MVDQNGVQQPWWISSVDPASLSLTVKGILAGVIPVALLVAKLAGVQLPDGTLNDIVQGITDLIVAIGGVVSVVATLYGAIRKIYYEFKNRGQA